MAQFFTLSDYSMSLPVILLTLFALGILLMDLIIPAEWKWFNALTAFIGVLFSAAAVYVRIQRPLDAAGLPAQTAFMNAMLLDHFAVYFWYLFLGGAAIAILMSVRYLEIEHEHHGEFYALILFSVVGMMCMAAGIDIVLIFIGLELMAVGSIFLGNFRLWPLAVLWLNRQHEPGCDSKPPRAGDGGTPESCQSNCGDCAADDDDRPTF